MAGRGKKLSDAYVELHADDSKLAPEVRVKATKVSREFGGQLNRTLKKLKIDDVDIKASPREALDAINLTEARLRELARNAESVEIKVRTEAALKQVAQFRKRLGDVGEEAGPPAAKKFIDRFGDRLQPLMSKLSLVTPIATAAGAAGLAAAPVLISAMASGLAAGAGAGVLGAGIAALAKDPAIAQRSAEIGQRFMTNVQRNARMAFEGPVIQSLDRLDAAGLRTAERLGAAFRKLAPEIDPLVGKLILAGETMTGTLIRVAGESGPALDGLGDSVLLLTAGVSSFIQALADGGPEAAGNLRLIAGATADVLAFSGQMLNLFNKLSTNAWVTGPLLPLLRKHYSGVADESGKLAEEQGKVDAATEGATIRMQLNAEQAEAAKKAINPLWAAQEKLATTLQTVDAAARGELSAMRGLSNELRSQTDPAFALITAQSTMKAAQDKAAEAVRKHGRNSKEARAATRELATAALDLQGKAGDLAGKFDGKLTPSMRATFRAAGLTKSQIKDVESQLRTARTAADRYAGTYDAKIKLSDPDKVAGKFIALSSMQKALKGGTTIPIQARRAFAYAGGGPVRGPFIHKTADNVIAALTPQEHVWTVDEVRGAGGHKRVEHLRAMAKSGRLPAYAGGGAVWPFPTTTGMTRVPSRKEAADAVIPSFGSWPSSPSAQRGDSGVWRRVVALIRSGPKMGEFGNAYRPGDPKWHGSGRAVDWMGYNMDALASFLAARRPLELIHRTRNRDYAYTRGVNKGSFNEALMNAHKNHIHAAFGKGGPVLPIQKVASADTGRAVLEQGWNLLRNDTGAREHLSTGGGDVHLHFHDSVITSKAAAADLVAGGLRQAVRDRKIVLAGTTIR